MPQIIRIFIIITLFSLKLQAQKVEIVFCADLSGSTNGMITSLQKTIWSVANEMDAKSSVSDVRYGFVGFGRKSFGKDNQFSKVLHDLSGDVNTIGYSLLKSQIQIQGCDAYPQKAINDCIENISWSKDDAVQKIVILIGNGTIPKKQMAKQVKKAKKKSIQITPIYYKSRQKSGEEKQWEAFAKTCNNELRVATPIKSTITFHKAYDETFLQNTGERLKGSYIPYGESGVKEFKKIKYIFKTLKERSKENYEEMLVYQSSYHVQGKNKSWDLIDLASQEKVDFSKIEMEKLPLFLQSFSPLQLEKYVNLKIKERKLLVKKIRLEIEKRNDYSKRKQLKSQHFVGKGGLSIILQVYINSQFEKSGLTSNAPSN